MASTPGQPATERFTPSLLDRLCPDPRSMETSRDSTSCSWEAYRKSLLRDITDLLNTRATLSEGHLLAFPRVSESVLAYGLPEVSRTSVGDERGVDQLALALTEVIRRFEPRLVRPRITSSKLIGSALVQFRLEAEVDADPAPLKLVFDTTFNADAGHYNVEDHLDEG